MSTNIPIHCSYKELVSLKDLKSHPKNRNKHPKEQIERLALIFKYQGIRHPIKVSNLSGFITSGHGRLEAAISLGMTKFPVDYQDYESDEQEYADLQADNAIASWSELDFSGINFDLQDLGPDFDIDLLGIKDFVLEPADKLDPQCDEDEVPEPKETICKLGDVWQLGNHRLMCGDSTSIDAVEKLVNGEKANMVFTDPPYNTGMKSNSGSTWLNHMFDDNFSEENWQYLLSSMCSNYWINMADNSVAYICLDWRRSFELVPHIKNHFKLSNIVVWDKIVHGLGSDYKYTYELIHVCKKGDPTLNTHQGDKEYQDIWHIQRKMGKDEDPATKKPIEIIDRAIRHASKDKDIILDLFGGSGSTLIACEKTNRKCLMMELDPHYCDVIIARWEKYTGNKAKLLTHNSEDTANVDSR